MAKDTRLESLEKDIPFLETLNNPTADKIIKVIKSKQLHHLIDGDRLNKIKNTVEKFKKNSKDQKLVTINDPTPSQELKDKAKGKIVDYIDLESSDEDGDITTTAEINSKKKNDLNEDSSDEEIEFYQVTDTSIKVKPPDPTKSEKANDIKIEQNEHLDSDSDLEIISDSENVGKENLANNLKNMKSEATNKSKENLENINVKIEGNLFTRRNETIQTDKRKTSEKCDTEKNSDTEKQNIKSTELDNNKIKNLKSPAIKETDCNTIELLDSDSESSPSHTGSLLSLNSDDLNEIAKDYISQERELIKVTTKKKKQQPKKSPETRGNPLDNIKEQNLKGSNSYINQNKDKSELKPNTKSESLEKIIKPKISTILSSNDNENSKSDSENESEDKTPAIEENQNYSTLSQKSLIELSITLEEKLGLAPKEPSLVESPLVSPSLVTMNQIIRDPRLNKLINQSNTPSIISQQIISPPINTVTMIGSIPSASNCNTLLPNMQLYPLPLPVPPVAPFQQPLPNIVNSSSFNNPIIECSKVPTASVPHRVYTNTYVPPAPSYRKDDILSALENSNMLPSRRGTQGNGNQSNSTSTLYTASKQTYGDFVRQRNEAKLRAEREAHERAVREAELLGIHNPTNKESEKISVETSIRPTNKIENRIEDCTISAKSTSNSDNNNESEQNNDETLSKASSKIVKKNSLNQMDETNSRIKKTVPFVSKNSKLKGLSDSSSEDDNAINQKAIIKQKITEEVNNMKNDLNQSEGNKKLCDVVIEALRKDFDPILSEMQLVNIENIVKRYTKDVVYSNDSSKKEDDAVDQNIIQNQIEPQEFVKVSRRVSKKSTTKPHSNNNLNPSRELKNLHEQIDGFYDRDQILASAGKNRNSSKLALEKITNKEPEKSQSDDELYTNNTNATDISSKRKSLHIEGTFNETDHNHNSYPKESTCKNYENKNGCILAQDDNDYDTDDFTTHLKEKEAKLKKRLTKKQIKKKICFEKELRVTVRKLKLKDTEIESKNNPILKPLATMPILPSASKEKERKKTNNHNEKIRNTDSSHHCHNQNFMKKCIICGELTKDVVSHYVHSHLEDKNHEVYCARLPNVIAKKFKENPIIGKMLQKKPFKCEAQCIFCSAIISGCHTDFYEHYATHTGEYAWECNGCNKKSSYKKQVVEHCRISCKDDGKPTRIYVYKKQNQISATFCTECNYVQLNKANVIRHLQNQHLISREPERLCENMFLVKFFEASPTESVERPNSLLDAQEFFLNNHDNIPVDMAHIEQEVEERIRISNEANLVSANENNDEIGIEIKMEELDEIFSMNISTTETCTAVTENEPNEIKIENSEVNCFQNAYTEVCGYDDEVIYIDSDNEDSKKDEEYGNESTISVNTEEILDANETQQKTKSSMDSNKRSALKPWLNCDNIDRMKSLEILCQINLSDFFKCMICPFSTNAIDEITNHIKKHRLDNVLQNITTNFFECSYCCTTLKSPDELVNHIKTEHNGSNFQCSKCFYRSCSSFSVKMHIQMYHKKNDKIIACDGSDIPILDQFKIITEKRQKYLKPFECHLCNGNERSKFYLKEDFENHFRNSHYNATFCRCNDHELLCCLFCHYETNFVDEIKNHMVNCHSNREQYVAARFRNPKFKKPIDSTVPNSTVIVFLSEVLSEKNFVQSKNLKKKLQKIYEIKKHFKITAANAGETLWNIKYLSHELAKYKNLKPKNDFDKSTVSLEVCQKEFYEMAKNASSNTGLIGEELYKCPILQCKSFFKDYEQWFNHIKIQHATFLYRNLKCPHCDEIHEIKEFNNHFNIKHLIHRYFCYLCGTSNSTKTALERHLQMEHRVSGTRKKIILSVESYPEEFFAVVPNEIFCDITTLTLHMRNVLKANKYYGKAQNLNEISNKIFNKNKLKLPKYVPVEKERYKCPEQSCSFVGQSENLFENHFKLIHRYIKSFKCRHCNFNIKEGIRDFDRIKDHIRMHNEILYICAKCPFFDHQRQILQKHVRSEHKLQMNMTKMVRSFRNEEEQFSFETCLEEGHIFLSLPFCLICEKELSEPEKIIDHMAEKHSVTIVYECQYCKALYHTLDAVINHINKEHNKVLSIRCKFDYKISQRSMQMQIEKENTSINELPTIIAAKTSKNIINKRSIAEEESTTTTTIARYDQPTKKLKTYHPAKISANTSVHKEYPLADLSMSSYHCENCAFTCNTEEELNKHKFLENHRNKVPVKYTCKSCSIEFIDIIDAIRHDLIDHHKSITNVASSISATEVDSLESSKIYPCKFCEFTSNTLDSVKEHIIHKHNNDELISIDNNNKYLSTAVNKSSSRAPTPPPPASNLPKIRVKPMESLIDPSLKMVMIPKANINMTNNDVIQSTESSPYNFENVYNIPACCQRIPTIINQRNEQPFNGNTIMPISPTPMTTPCTSSTVVYSNLRQLK